MYGHHTRPKISHNPNPLGLLGLCSGFRDSGRTVSVFNPSFPLPPLGALPHGECGFPATAQASSSIGPFSSLDHAPVCSWQWSLLPAWYVVAYCWAVAHCSGILVCKYLSKDGGIFPFPKKHSEKCACFLSHMSKPWISQPIHSLQLTDTGLASSDHIK